MHAVSYSTGSWLCLHTQFYTARVWPDFVIMLFWYIRRMCELLQSGEQSGERMQAANSLSALLSGGARKKAEVIQLSVS